MNFVENEGITHESETELRVEVMKNMIKTFGLVDATRFIDLIKRDKFNYTQWQRDLWKDKTATEIHNEAKEYYLKNKKKMIFKND